MNKIISKPFFAVVLFFVTIVSQARQEPPQPAPTGIGPGPGLPINENIYLLVIVSVLFGIYKIYNNKMIKTSK